MTTRSIISAEVLDIWYKIREYFNISKTIPLRIHWTPVYTIGSATGSAVTPEYIKRSKRNTTPYVNITIPDNIEWFDSHKENIKKVLTPKHFILEFQDILLKQGNMVILIIFPVICILKNLWEKYNFNYLP